MEEDAYCVVPVPGGWAVEHPSDEPLMFLSGEQAEAKAHELAQRAHCRGEACEVVIYDRDGVLLGRRCYGGSEAGPAPFQA